MFCLASELRRTSAASKKDVMTTSHHIVVLTFLLVFHACGPKRPSPVAIRFLLNSLHVALKDLLVCDPHKVKPGRRMSIVCKLQGAPIQNVSSLNHSWMTRSLRVAFKQKSAKILWQVPVLSSSVIMISVQHTHTQIGASEHGINGTGYFTRSNKEGKKHVNAKHKAHSAPGIQFQIWECVV